MTLEQLTHLHERVAGRFFLRQGQKLPQPVDLAWGETPLERTEPTALEAAFVQQEDIVQEQIDQGSPSPAGRGGQADVLEQLEDAMRLAARRYPGHMADGKELG